MTRDFRSMMVFARWQIWSIVAICLAGVLFTLPNLLPRDKAGWPSWAPHRQINLGLDLRGGSYLLLEVDMATVVKERIENLLDASRAALRTANTPFEAVEAQARGVTVRLRNPAQAPDAQKALRELITTSGAALTGTAVSDLELTTAPDGAISLSLTEAGLRDKATQAIALKRVGTCQVNHQARGKAPVQFEKRVVQCLQVMNQP
jgi:preprotein translocase subunit SecD